ncbi:MAG: ammonium transporter, partial [Limisphaerales bacterium]
MNRIHRTYAQKYVLWILLALGAFAITGFAAESGPQQLEDRIRKLESAAAGVNSGDNAWMLTSTALVLMMTAPGLILFYGGLVRSKNVLGTMMHSLFLMGLVSLLWATFGYSMAFGDGTFFGNPMQYFLLKGVGEAPNPDYAATIPHQTFMLFQMMFAIITPALISGAFAERMKFSAFVWYMIG